MRRLPRKKTRTGGLEDAPESVLHLVRTENSPRSAGPTSGAAQRHARVLSWTAHASAVVGPERRRGCQGRSPAMKLLIEKNPAALLLERTEDHFDTLIVDIASHDCHHVLMPWQIRVALHVGRTISFAMWCRKSRVTGRADT